MIIIRHQALNYLIWRALANAGVPLTKEPSGMSRTDGKRPHGQTLIPRKWRKSLAGDVTVANSFAILISQLLRCLERVLLKWRLRGKHRTTQTWPANIIFRPEAFETLALINQSGVDFIPEIGRRLEQASSDARERWFLFQRLSITVQRFNSVAFRGIFFAQPDLNTR